MPTRRALVLMLTLLCAGSLEAQLFVGVRAGQATSRQLVRFTAFAVPDTVAFIHDIPQGLRKTGSLASAVTSGVSAALEFNSWIALEGDLFFVEKGMRDAGAELRLSYIELPVLMRLAVPLTETGLHLYGDGGPALSQEISCRASLSVGGGAPLPADCNTWRETKRDFAWALGGGFLLRRPLYQLTASLRHTRGARDLDSGNSFGERFNHTNAFLVGFVARLR